MLKDKINSFYSKNYKILMFIPIIITIIALIIVGIHYKNTGDFFQKDVSLKGGITATLYTNQEISEEQVKNALNTEIVLRKISNLGSSKNSGIIIEVSDLTSAELKQRLENNLNIKLTSENFSIEETGPRLGEAFYRQLITAVIFAFILMGITVFITFRTLAPSLAVISAAFMDIIITLAVVNLFNISLSTAGIVGILSVIGYSVDTDILLTTWAIRKKEGMLFDRMYHSMKTGLTMTICAAVVMLIGILFSNSEVIKEMFTIIFIALIVDIFSTYFTNTGILWIYCKRKNIT
ncbi:hypothetical protein J4440_06650 [Candidatus Woesearchaeota archaeon]|nr:hypothetical protein [Candidatus Woesearchaeota archaeon]